MKRKSTGFSLIEVMIAVLVMSLGLLGVASTLILAMHSASSNYLHQQAVQYSYGIADRMRSNFQVASDPSAANPYVTAISASAGSAPGTNCASSTCNATQMAAYDVWQWKTALQNSLPGGRGAVAVSSAGVNLTQVTITLQWSDQPAQAAFNPASASSTSLVVVTAL